MKYIKLFEDFKNKILGSTSTEDGWTILRLDSYEEINNFFHKWYDDAEWIAKDGGYDIYYRDSKSWDKDEDEYYWHTKIAIMVDWKAFTIKTKEILSEPLYKIRDKKLTREQELTIRTWIGTDKNPKYHTYKGEYLGTEDGLALIKSPMSGNILKINKKGEITNL